MDCPLLKAPLRFKTILSWFKGNSCCVSRLKISVASLHHPNVAIGVVPKTWWLGEGEPDSTWRSPTHGVGIKAQQQRGATMLMGSAGKSACSSAPPGKDHVSWEEGKCLSSYQSNSPDRKGGRRELASSLVICQTN